MKVNCQYQFCLDIKLNRPLYAMRSQLLRHLREEHDRWWRSYSDLYDRGKCMHVLDDDGTWEYTDSAMEMITRCRAYDNLFNRVVEMDLLFTQDFGYYCKKVFIAINSLKPAFPASSVAVGTLDNAVKELRKFVMMQNNVEGTRERAS